MEIAIHRQEKPTQFSRILYIPPNEIHYSGWDVLMPNGEIVIKTGRGSSIDDLFQRYGYVVKRLNFGDKFDAKNPLAVGMHAGKDADDEVAVNQYISRKAGISMPKRDTLLKAMKSADPVVAKFIGAHSGNNKYLLETQEQKVKFLIPLIDIDNVLGNIRIFPNGEPNYSEQFRNEMADKVERTLPLVFDVMNKAEEMGTVDNTHRTYLALAQYVKQIENHVLFQELVDTPSKHYPTFRVIADAFGHIHYVALLFSKHMKDEGILKFTTPQQNLSIADLQKIVSDSNSLLDYLYTHPLSPFFLASKSIKSYTDGVSEEIILEGQAIDDQETRQVLQDLGINPDAALPPFRVLQLGKRLGRAFRPYNIYGGFDLIPRVDKEYNLLEAHDQPGLAPSGFGLPDDADDAKVTEKLIDNALVASKNPQKSFSYFGLKY